jgi:hypothetical protein
MSASGSDNLKIPIEIKTEDLDEIRALINDLASAESDIHSLKPRKGKGGDSSSRSAFVNSPENTFGAFGSLGSQQEATPIKGRDSKSKAPFQRENEFKKLQDEVAENKSNTAGIAQGLGQAFGLGSFGRANLFKGEQLGAKIAAGMGAGNSGIIAGASLAKGGLGGILGKISGVAGKAFLPLAAIMTIVSTVQLVVSEMFKPGGEFDRRYRRVIKDEIAGSVDQTEKQAIKQGSKVVRVETIAGVRGERGLNSSLSNLLSNNSVYLNDLHQKARGLKP